MTVDNEKEEVIKELKSLIAINNKKQADFQAYYGYGPEVGCITREAMRMAALLPKMLSLGIKLDDL